MELRTKPYEDSCLIYPDSKGEPIKILIKNGHAIHYRLEEMKYGDHVHEAGADVVGAELPKIIKTQSL